MQKITSIIGIIFGVSVAVASGEKPAINQISENEAVEMAKRCLASMSAPVKPNETVSIEVRDDANGKLYWLVKVAIMPPLPEGARFINIYNKTDIRYFGHHFTKKLRYKNGGCR
jgi:hypothetical protein